MAKERARGRFEGFQGPRPLGQGESDIFNEDLSVKPGNFPELDDRNYPQELVSKLKQEQQGESCPPANRRPRTLLRGFHKYRTAAYIHDQGGGHNADRHYARWPAYEAQLLKKALEDGTISQQTHDVLASESTWKAELAFPREGSPQRYGRGSERFLLVNVWQHQSKGDSFFLTGQHRPYKWTAHHLIPHELLQEKTPGKRNGLDRDVYNLLVQSGYDVNNGHNGIITPANEWDAPLHCIIQHVGSHPAYSLYALKLIRNTIASLSKILDAPPRDHRQALAEILENLTRCENDLWHHIAKLSENIIYTALNGEQATNAHIVHQKGKKTFSRFGILT